MSKEWGEYNMWNNAVVAGALSACDTRNMVEAIFSKFDVADTKTKIDCLNECMGNPKTFYTAGEKTPEDIKYELTMEAFLTGAWKLVKLI